MRTPFLSVLGLAFVCLLQTQAEVPVQPDFQADQATFDFEAEDETDFETAQFIGTWFSLGIASNSPWFKEKKSVMKMCTTVVTPLEDGNLEVTSTYPKHDTCETRKSIFVPTGQPGRFSYTSTRTGSQQDVTVVETNYSEYALMVAKKRDAEGTMVTLYGRSKEMRPELMEKFTQLALTQGLTQDDILMLPKTDRCMEGTV